MQCFKNAEEISAVSVLDRAFHYGDGCFSTARIRNGQIELEALHLLRLQHGCERLYLNANLAFIQQSIQQLQQRYPQVNGTLKIIISRGDGQRGYSLPAQEADVWVFFILKQWMISTMKKSPVVC